MTQAFTDIQLQQLRGLIQEEFQKNEDRVMSAVKTLISTELEPLKKEVRSLKVENRSLRARLTHLESHSRRSNVEIVGFPTEPDLPASEVVQRIATQCGYQLIDSAVVAAHRNGKKKKAADDGVETQDIVVEFRDRRVLNDFLDNVKSFSQKQKGLTAKNFCSRAAPTKLSVFRQIPKELKRLRWLALQKKAELNYKFCWISRSGKLMMRKDTDSEPLWITTEEDFAKLK